MSEISESDFENMEREVRENINLIMTPEVNEDDLSTGLFWVYTVGMREHYNLQEMEMRDVPGMFIRSAANAINGIAAYRVLNQDNPILVGQAIGWGCGDILVEQGEDWDGRFTWTADEMLRLTSRVTDIQPGPDCIPDEA
jgi:hypothetical protein